MTYHFDWLMDHPHWTFELAVATAVDEFPSEWKRYWGIGGDACPEHLDPDEWQAAKEMHDLARRICNAAGALQGMKLPEQLRTLPPILTKEAKDERESRRELVKRLEASLTPEQEGPGPVKDLIHFLKWSEGEAGTKEVLFRTAVEIYSYPDFGCAPGEVARRLLDLLEFLMRTKGEITREYLRRVAMCYVRDMRPEMAVMSRAVMETALQIESVENRIQDHLKVKGKRHPGLGDWIEAAAAVGVLDETGVLSAGVVKDAGDDAVHNAPQQAPEAWVVLENLRTVLQQVERFQKGG